MALAVVGETCAITFDGEDYRCYQFTLSKSGTRVSCKAFIDGVGVNPELVTGVGKELSASFRDDVTEIFDINDDVTIAYTIGTSAEVSGLYTVLSVESPNPAEGISDFTVTFKYKAASAPAS